MRLFQFLNNLALLIVPSLATPVHSATLTPSNPAFFSVADGFPPPDSPPLLPFLNASDVSWHPGANKTLTGHPNRLMGTIAYAPDILVPLAGRFSTYFNGNEDGQIPFLSPEELVSVTARTATRLQCEYVFSNAIHQLLIFPRNYLDPDSGFRKDQWTREQISLAVRMPAQDIVSGGGPWTARQRMLLRIVDEQVDLNHKSALETMHEALAVLGDGGEGVILGSGDVVEVLSLFGLFSTYCSISNSMRVEVETDYTVAEIILHQLLEGVKPNTAS
ncbi:hypothetical protein BKA67DRAFT_643174 [Truncatella angustata]|uniref:Uncharacterized protein n=1 Tax=Truncatella angustata TaxID=152316 RepID=A0A9P8URY3_9PEZI|nr:uncharacterized protein BKA67DRAFT_643174 [Truncatella angustata]KAH6657129.1 hypothetical protein BKA67DRAFT_643174 [Truncatella angustata]